MTLREKFYSTVLEWRIIDLIDEANYLPYGENDWKAIYRNLETCNPGVDIYTAEMINNEIEIFYNA